jgi:hypothetical protein
MAQQAVRDSKKKKSAVVKKRDRFSWTPKNEKSKKLEPS